MSLEISTQRFSPGDSRELTLQKHTTPPRPSPPGLTASPRQHSLRSLCREQLVLCKFKVLWTLARKSISTRRSLPFLDFHRMMKSKIMVSTENHPVTLKHTRHLLLEASLNRTTMLSHSMQSVQVTINIDSTATALYETLPTCLELC